MHTRCYAALRYCYALRRAAAVMAEMLSLLIRWLLMPFDAITPPSAPLHY